MCVSLLTFFSIVRHKKRDINNSIFPSNRLYIPVYGAINTLKLIKDE